MGQRLHVPQDHHLITQEPQSPARSPLGRSAAGHCNQMSFGSSVDFPFINTCAWFGLSCCFQAFFNKLLANAFDGGTPATHRFRNLRIRLAGTALSLVSQKQHPGTHQLSRRRLTRRNQLPQFLPLVCSQRHTLALFHDTLLANWPSMNPGQECTIHQLTNDRALGLIIGWLFSGFLYWGSVEYAHIAFLIADGVGFAVRREAQTIFHEL